MTRFRYFARKPPNGDGRWAHQWFWPSVVLTIAAGMAAVLLVA